MERNKNFFKNLKKLTKFQIVSSLALFLFILYLGYQTRLVPNIYKSCYISANTSCEGNYTDNKCCISDLIYKPEDNVPKERISREMMFFGILLTSAVIYSFISSVILGKKINERDAIAIAKDNIRWKQKEGIIPQGDIKHVGYTTRIRTDLDKEKLIKWVIGVEVDSKEDMDYYYHVEVKPFWESNLYEDHIIAVCPRDIKLTNLQTDKDEMQDVKWIAKPEVVREKRYEKEVGKFEH